MDCVDFMLSREEEYAKALTLAHEAKRAAIRSRELTSLLEAEIVAAAQAEGLIDGKNAEERKVQLVSIPRQNERYQTGWIATVKAEETSAEQDMLLKIAEIRYKTAIELIRWATAHGALTVEDVLYSKLEEIEGE